TTCSFSPATVTPSGAAVSTQLTIAASAQAALQSNPNPYLPGAALAAVFCFFSWRRRRAFHLLLPLAVIAVMAGFISGCGGGGSSPVSTPKSPTTATVTVTATSGTLQQTTAVSLTVN